MNHSCITLSEIFWFELTTEVQHDIRDGNGLHLQQAAYTALLKKARE
jgi:hypothetical protein